MAGVWWYRSNRSDPLPKANNVPIINNPAFAHAPAPAPPANDAADYMVASKQQQIMYDDAKSFRELQAQGVVQGGLYVEPSLGQMAEYDAANAARGVNDADGYRIGITSLHRATSAGAGAAGSDGLIYDKPGVKGGTLLKAPVYAEHAPGMGARPRAQTARDDAGAGSGADTKVYANDAYGNVAGSTTEEQQHQRPRAHTEWDAPALSAGRGGRRLSAGGGGAGGGGGRGAGRGAEAGAINKLTRKASVCSGFAGDEMDESPV
jgi:hypothetical protein